MRVQSAMCEGQDSQLSGSITESAKSCQVIREHEILVESRELYNDSGREIVPARCALSATLVLVEVRKSSDRGNHVN